jgi:hypothetical protein
MSVLPPAGAGAVELSAGERLRIAQREGGQVVDTWALNPADLGEWLSMEHTRVALTKLSISVGDQLCSSRRRPMLTLSEDTSPGVHDTLMAACDPERYPAARSERRSPELRRELQESARRSGARGAAAARDAESVHEDPVARRRHACLRRPWGAERPAVSTGPDKLPVRSAKAPAR